MKIKVMAFAENPARSKIIIDDTTTEQVYYFCIRDIIALITMAMIQIIELPSLIQFVCGFIWNILRGKTIKQTKTVVVARVVL